jgi:hypothetical protein
VEIGGNWWKLVEIGRLEIGDALRKSYHSLMEIGDALRKSWKLMEIGDALRKSDGNW